MAENKSTSLKWCFIHVGIYTGMMTLLTIPIFSYLGATLKSSIVLALIFGISNGMLHIITDFITSKLSNYFYKKGNYYGFFNVIGFDQFVHASCLILTVTNLEYLIHWFEPILTLIL